MKIKGVLLCGGEGTRLRPMTEVINKHLIRVYDRPMAEYPLLKMIEAGVDEVLIVSGGENFAAVVKYFGSGKKWNINITHAIQDQAGGIAEALGLAKSFVGQNFVMVCLGDNIWTMDLRSEVVSHDWPECTLFSCESNTPERFGVLKFNDQGRAIDVIEKPKEFISNQILAGIYVFGPSVFEVIAVLKPSERGELEISDVNKYYIRSGKARIVQMDGWWSDCGTIETLLQTEEKIKNDRSIQALCPEGGH